MKRIRVGIIGANPDRGWAAQAHIPALKSLSDDFEITALSTSRRESADAAGKLFGVLLAFDNHQDLVNSADVDVVAVTVKVPHHLQLATAALDPTRPHRGRALSLPRRSARALGDHDRTAKVLHHCGDGRKQAHDRG